MAVGLRSAVCGECGCGGQCGGEGFGEDGGEGAALGDAGAARDGTGCGCVEEVVEVVGGGRVCVGGDYEGEGAGAEGVEGELEEA